MTKPKPVKPEDAGTKVGDLMKELRKKKDAKANLEEELSELNKAIQGIELGALPAAFAEAQIPEGASVTIPGIGRGKVEQGVWVQVKADNKHLLNDQVRALGDGDLIKETIHPKTLESWIRGRLLAGEEIPDAVDTRFFTKVKFTKVGG